MPTILTAKIGENYLFKNKIIDKNGDLINKDGDPKYNQIMSVIAGLFIGNLILLLDLRNKNKLIREREVENFYSKIIKNSDYENIKKYLNLELKEFLNQLELRYANLNFYNNIGDRKIYYKYFNFKDELEKAFVVSI